MVPKFKKKKDIKFKKKNRIREKETKSELSSSLSYGKNRAKKCITKLNNEFEASKMC